MTEREKLIEILLKIYEGNAHFVFYFTEDEAAVVADNLLENGVVLVDTNSVKRENLPLIQQAFNIPLDELAKIVEKHIAQNGLAYATPNFELLEG